MDSYTQKCKPIAFDSFWQLDPVNKFALWYSKRDLTACMESESSLDDVLNNIGTYYDRDGNYSGLGYYRQLPVQATQGEITGVVERVREREPETMVEIGTHFGGSLYVWMRALSSLKTVVSIDLQFAPTVRLFETVARESKQNLSMIQGNANDPDIRNEAVKKAGTTEFDFIYIDADHSYEGIKSHFELYRPLVSSEGIICMNCVEDSNYGVEKFWSEIESEYDCEKVSGEKPGVSGLVYI